MSSKTVCAEFYGHSGKCVIMFVGGLKTSIKKKHLLKLRGVFFCQSVSQLQLVEENENYSVSVSSNSSSVSDSEGSMTLNFSNCSSSPVK